MKIKLSKIFYLIIIFILLLDFKFFYIIPRSFLDSINNNHQKIVIVLVILISLVLFCKYIMRSQNLIFKNYILIFILLYILEFLFSIIRYKQGLINVLIADNYYLILLAYFIFVYYFTIEGKIFSFKKWIINISLILELLFIMQSIIINYNIKLLNIDYAQMRFNELRIYEASGIYIVMGILFSLESIINGDKKIKNIICCLLGLINVIFVAKTRMIMLILFISMLFMIFYKFKKNAVKIIIILTILIISSTFLLKTEIAQIYLESVQNIDSQFGIRNETIEMYMGQIKKHPLIGMGFIRDMENSPATILLRGPRGVFTRTDVGIVGFTNCFGLLGLIWYGILIFKLGKQIIICCKTKMINHNLSLLGIYIFIVLGSGTIIVMDASRILLFVIFISMIEGINSEEIFLREIKN
ncbi:hypothetical protein [Turicibacter sp. TS3]|uniref:hypothetical protein n=1 Tax=Turicibacter sp. TS3 TaxID=2304578 RepID=UPI00137A1964|nr:hypothetical protein [Turicibacter sp. TS3]NCE77812.1 hypothetical protein [Turicibacter sp. TS3]